MWGGLRDSCWKRCAEEWVALQFEQDLHAQHTQAFKPQSLRFAALTGWELNPVMVSEGRASGKWLVWIRLPGWSPRWNHCGFLRKDHIHECVPCCSLLPGSPEVRPPHTTLPPAASTLLGHRLTLDCEPGTSGQLPPCPSGCLQVFVTAMRSWPLHLKTGSDF